jgi:hypothetical protein
MNLAVLTPDDAQQTLVDSLLELVIQTPSASQPILKR